MIVTVFSAILFDLDDTLYPERSFVLSGFRAAADHAASFLPLDANALLEKLKQLFEEGVRANTFQRLLESFQHGNAELEQAMVSAYRNHRPKINVYPEVVETLQRLRENYQLGLVSDGWLAVQQRKFKALGIQHLFDVVVFSDAWGREHWKPSSKPFQVALERLNISHADRAVYVGDNALKDFVGARRLGIHTIQICRDGGQYASAAPPTADHKADLEIQSLLDLERALNQLSTRQT
jgi:putative hydrolase of the HAD superfamily